MQCTECGSGRLDPLPDVQAQDMFGPEYFNGGVAGGYADYGSDAPLHRRNARTRLTLMEKAEADPPGRILELGTGYGYFLDEARSLGWEVAGIDVSAHARARSRELALDVRAELTELDGEADVLAAFQVVEHMRYPDVELDRGIAKLRTGGLVIIETWDRSHWAARVFGRAWQQVAPPSIIHLFTEAGLRTMAARAGLQNTKIQSTAKVVSLGAVVGQLATQHPRWSPLLNRARTSPLANRPLSYRFGDLVTLTARKI